MHRPIVILTALDLEHQSIRDRMTGVTTQVHPQGTRFDVGVVPSGGGRVVLALVGKGNQAAAVLAERVINEFSPAALLFVGVAGALHSHVRLGDVVVATHVYAYHGGTSEDDGLKSRPRAWETSHAADQAARQVARQIAAGWAREQAGEGERAPMIHFGPIVAGEVVLNSRTSVEARYIRERYNDALAIEMEGAGVAQAGHLNRALPVVVIRGISDYADGTKHESGDARWQPRAVRNAATLALALVPELAVTDSTDVRNGATAAGPGEGGAGGRTTNVAGRDVVISAQIDTVNGNVTVGMPSRTQARS